jgi:hypothetical protein
MHLQNILCLFGDTVQIKWRNSITQAIGKKLLWLQPKLWKTQLKCYLGLTQRWIVCNSSKNLVLLALQELCNKFLKFAASFSFFVPKKSRSWVKKHHLTTKCLYTTDINNLDITLCLRLLQTMINIFHSIICFH